jgi:transketolase
VFEALKAHEDLKKSGLNIRVIDLYSVQPVDRATLVRSGRATGNTIVTVEDHYAAGGIGDAVAEAVAGEGIAVHRLAVREIPRSGKPEEMLEKFGIGAKQIVETCQSLVLGRTVTSDK